MKSLSFKPFLAQSIHLGNKTQTRREVIPAPELHEPKTPSPIEDYVAYLNAFRKKGLTQLQVDGPAQGYITPACPYGKIGDILYVKEEYYQLGHWAIDHTRVRKSGRQAWTFVPDDDQILYSENPPDVFRKGRHHESPHVTAWHKRLAMFMPMAHARTFVRIENIRLEKLQSISVNDAIAEGIEELGIYSFPIYRDYFDKTNDGFQHAPSSFLSLWKYINGEEAVKRNPFVWVIEFKRFLGN